MNQPGPLAPEALEVRRADLSDRPLLEGFSCSRGEEWEDEVEAHIREDLLDLIGGTDTDHRVILVLHEGRLLAVGAHATEAVLVVPNDLMPMIRLHLLAITVEDQGRRLDDGSPLADALFAATATDALETWGGFPLTAIVARENFRSIAVLERNGRFSQVRHGLDHIRMTGSFAPQE